MANPQESVRAALKLHGKLFAKDLLPSDRQKLAREIAGTLFTAEANSAVSNRARILFLRLRTNAHLAALEDPLKSRNENLVWKDYEELESLLD